MNRRSFLLHAALTPFLGFIASLRANGVAKSQLMEEAIIVSVGNTLSADFAIEGWHEKDCDPTKTRIITLSTSWKSDWL